MRLVRAISALFITGSLCALTGQSAFASYSVGAVGHDVSYPQCASSGSASATVSASGSFGVVGVTGGRPFGPNSCAASEYAWASKLPQAPGLYMNTANPAPTSSYYWPTSGTSDPALCQNAASTTDPGCAYDYGWHSAADALSKEAASLPSPAAMAWWLDVETANSWNGNGSANAADLQGATDYLRSQGVPAVGIYSTASQWSSITGGYSASTATTFASGWAPEFTARYPMTNSPLWVAGLGSYSTANNNCATSFTGGPVSLAQYSDGSGYDADLSCPTPGASPALQVTLTSGSSAGSKSGYRIPLKAVTTSPAGTAVAGATVSWTADSGACPTTASAVAAGTGTTSSSGGYAFRLSVKSAGFYCVTATATAGGYTSGSTAISVRAG